MGNNLKVLPTPATQMQIEEMATLMKSVSPFELAKSKRKFRATVTKYNEQIFEMGCDYVRSEWKATGHAVPSKVGMARYLGISKSTLDTGVLTR